MNVILFWKLILCHLFNMDEFLLYKKQIFASITRFSYYGKTYDHKNLSRVGLKGKKQEKSENTLNLSETIFITQKSNFSLEIQFY